MKPTAKQKSYLASERVIHDDLVVKCLPLVQTAQRVWQQGKGDPSFVVLWPSEPLKDADGTRIEDEVLAEFPRQNTHAALRRLVDRTKAFGLLVIELRPDALSAVFESRHGAHSWVYPIERHGDVRVLGSLVSATDTVSLGLLWGPQD